MPTPTYHIGRSWSGSVLENECPCPKAPCGLVPDDQTVPECPEHAPERCKTMRQRHLAATCPNRDTACECHTFGQCLTSTGCEECRVYGDESCGLPLDPDEES
jgi:hypothetical protein